MSGRNIAAIVTFLGGIGGIFAGLATGVVAAIGVGSLAFVAGILLYRRG